MIAEGLVLGVKVIAIAENSRDQPLVCMAFLFNLFAQTLTSSKQARDSIQFSNDDLLLLTGF